jgi:hypothetical protein
MSQLTTPPSAADPLADLSKSPLPTQKTLKMRRNLVFQFTRFLSFNSRIMRMVIKGHH